MPEQFKGLPLEISSLIFGFFHYKDFYYTSRVSKSWKELTLTTLLKKIEPSLTLEDLRKLESKELVLKILNNQELGVLLFYKEFYSRFSNTDILEIMNKNYQGAT